MTAKQISLDSGEGRNAGHSTLGGTMAEQIGVEMIVTRTVEQVEVDWDHEGAIYITQESSADNERDVVRIYPEHVDRMIEALKAARVAALQAQKAAEDEGSNA